MINSFLNSKDGMNQLQQVLSSLGVAPTNQAPESPSNAPNIDMNMLGSILSGLTGGNATAANIANTAPIPTQQSTPSIDMNMLGSMLAGLTGGNATAANIANTAPIPTQQSTPSIDMNMLSSMLAGLTGGNTTAANTAPIPTQQSTPSIDMNMLGSMLSSLTGGGNSGSTSNGGGFSLPNFDINTIMLLQRAFSAISQPDKNTQLLIALKPHFSEERAKKVDDAVKIMQLLRLLPFIKESGLLKLWGGEKHERVDA